MHSVIFGNICVPGNDYLFLLITDIIFIYKYFSDIHLCATHYYYLLLLYFQTLCNKILSLQLHYNLNFRII